MAAHQAPPPLGFSRQEHWSRLPFPSPVHESEKWKSSRSVVSDSVSSDCQIINLFYFFHSWNEHSQPVLPKYLKIKSLTHNGRFFTMKTESVTHPNRSYGNYNQFSLALRSKTGLIIRPWKHLMSICYLSGIDHSCCMYPASALKSCRLI